MNFEAIEKALVTMGKAMLGVMEKLDRLVKVNEEILEELRKNNN
jgi:hypothetical protein